MLYATLDIDWMDDPTYYALHDVDPAHVLRFLRCIVWAKRANCKGRIIRVDGAPIQIREMARLHDGPGAEYISRWENFISIALDVGLLATDLDYECYCIADWRRWHRSPSDEPEAIRERVAKHRQRKASLGCNESVTTCNGCNDTEQSRAEQSKAEQIPPNPPGENGGAFGSRSENKNESNSSPSEPPFATRVQEIIGVKPTKRELKQARELLKTALPAGWTEPGWRRAIIDELKRQVQAVADDLSAGKPIAAPTAIAIARAKVQLQRAARCPEERAS